MIKLIYKLTIVIACIAATHPAFAVPKKVPAQKFIDTSSAAKLQLPAGFNATTAFEGLAGARHMAVTKQGGLYVKLSKLRDGKGIVYLKDTNGDGKLEEQAAFGDYPGTGISIKNDYLYTSSNDDVYRYN
ncbi:MAG: hypothetical protein ACR2KZ_08955 [Segetibacter sp.]